MSECSYAFLRYYGPDGTCCAVAKTGRKNTHLVIIDYPLRVVTVPKDDPGLSVASSKSLAEAVISFFDVATRCGITEGARQILTEASAAA